MSSDYAFIETSRRRRTILRPDEDFVVIPLDDDPDDDDEICKVHNVNKTTHRRGTLFWRKNPLSAARRQARNSATFVMMGRRRRQVVLLTSVVALCLLCFSQRDDCHVFFWRYSRHQSPEELPILLHPFASSTDVLNETWPDPLILLPSNNKPDYGDLSFASLRHDADFSRTVASDDELAYEKYRSTLFKHMDTVTVPDYCEHDDEIILADTCRRPNWMSLHFPNCNRFHQVDLSRDKDSIHDYDSYLLDDGTYRDIWMVWNHEIVVLKTLRFRFRFSIENFVDMQRDAQVMEWLSSSPRIMNIYGSCGTSALVQYIPHSIEDQIVPGEGMAVYRHLNEDELFKEPQNNFTGVEKLEMALQMAESLADMHGYKGGVIVHDDVQLCQWLQTDSGKVILGDFNRAEVMEWNVTSGSYCKYKNGGGSWRYRAPEEYRNDALDEMIDVFSFGNNIYSLLTGLWVFYNTSSDRTVQKELMAGKRAFVDDRYRTRSYAEGKLGELMERCWEHDPAKRIDIFETVRFLREAVKENKLQRSAENM